MSAGFALSGSSSIPRSRSASASASSLSDFNPSKDHDNDDGGDSDGWEDAQPSEDESSPMTCLLDDAELTTVTALLDHCKTAHGFDLALTRQELGLDFYETVKCINYLRRYARTNKGLPQTPLDRAAFVDDEFLKPVVEDDALLCGIDEILEAGEDGGGGERARAGGEGGGTALREVRAKVDGLEEELARLKDRFGAYQGAVKKALEDRLDDDGPSAGSMTAGKQGHGSRLANGEVKRGDGVDDDSHYFTSYSYNDIHETMLKDTVRTDAYRDFIYEHKQLFRDKVVLDVGCGTGILSMFCAKAGAKRVIAVDNSDIINKARENVFENGLGGVVTCLRGKIEEVSLPVKQVDLIVSEWMGYCLLYEAMLDSVLWARDHFLAPDGLMVPSHTTIRLAPLADPDYVSSHISFWHSVYGFSMTSMLASITDDVLIRHLSPSNLAGPSTPVLHLPLHTITPQDLTFVKDFEVKVSEDIDALDGWVLWFDTFFLPSRDAVVSADAHAEDWAKQGRPGVAFTTGPGGEETHWRQGVLLIDHIKKPGRPLSKGQTICGTIGYQKREDNSRELDVAMSWDAAGVESGESGESGKQLWHMR